MRITHPKKFIRTNLGFIRVRNQTGGHGQNVKMTTDFQTCRPFWQTAEPGNIPLCSDLEKGWKSMVLFCICNWTEGAISTFVGNTLYKILYWLLPIGMKVMHMDNTGFRKIE